MPREPFLINPPKRLRKNPLGETLVTVGGNPMARMRRRYAFDDNPLKYVGVIKSLGPKHYRYDLVAGKSKRKKYSRKRVMKNPCYTNAWFDDARGHRVAALKGWRKRRRYYDNAWFDDARGHRVAALKGWRKRRRYYDNAWFDDARGHRVAALKGWRKRRRSVSRSRSKRYIRKRYRRNAPEFVEAFTDIFKVQNWLPYAVTGGLSLTTTAVLPNMIAPVMISQPVTGPFVKYGIQLVNAFLGAPVVDMVVGRRHADVWLVTSVGYVGYQLLRDFVVKPFLPQFAVGLGQYEDYYSAVEPYQEVGQASSYGVSAFPEEVSAFPEEVSAYPYDGRYGH